MTITEAPAGTRPAEHIVAEARALVDGAYRAAVDQLPDQVRHIAGYHAGWWDADGLPGAGGGKGLRPALVLACSRAAGGQVEAAIPAAVAVELVHDFSLLHDDIMDGDLTRRNRASAWSLFGVSAAILAGDTLMSLAVHTLAGGPGARVLTEAMLELCAGQSADLAFQGRVDVALDESMAMARAKTGALLGCACQLGALAGGADADSALAFRWFGRDLGLAFQLVDDLLGIWGDPRVTGKPVHSDLERRKKSLPVVAALTSAMPAGERLRELYRDNDPLDARGLRHAAALIEEAGGRAWARAEAEIQLQAAMEHLTGADADPCARRDLETLGAHITGRDR